MKNLNRIASGAVRGGGGGGGLGQILAFTIQYSGLYFSPVPAPGTYPGSRWSGSGFPVGGTGATFNVTFNGGVAASDIQLTDGGSGYVNFEEIEIELASQPTPTQRCRIQITSVS